MSKIKVSIQTEDKEDGGWVEEEVMYWSGELDKVLKRLNDLGFKVEED